MEKYIEQLEQTFDANGFDNFKHFSKEERLLALYAFYNFYHADTSSIMDLLANIVYEEDSKDHVDGIFLDSEADEESVEIVSSFYLLNGLDFLSVDNLETYYSQMFTGAFEALHQTRTTRNKLINFFSQDDDYAFGEGKRKLTLNIITNYKPKSDIKRKITARVNKIKLNNYTTCKITFGQELEQGVLEIESPKEYVDQGFLILDKENNYLKFGYENSLIVNVSAKSLKKLYSQFWNQGLFAQNLRYYVKQAKIDGKIIDSIKNKGQNFWYYNNGIILICDNYSISGKSILLDKFSIINGGQTSKLIGETEFEDDFYLQCKVIRNKYNNPLEKSTFISEVAEASNTQKPIKDKDIVANRVEQRQLQAKMAQVGVFVQIKRGSVINKKVYPEAWQNTTNEELGQFIYSFFYQCPGSARSNKASITGNKSRYEQIFNKDYAAALLRDLCYYKSFYKNWIKLLAKNNYYDDPYMKGLTQNGLLCFVAVLGVISKLYFNDFYSEKLKGLNFSEKMNLLSQYDLSHNIFKDNILSYSQDIYSFLMFIYKKYVKEGYLEAKEDDPNIIYSNFLKTDKNYKRFIFRNILKDFNSEDCQYINNLFIKPTQNNIDINKKILEEHYKEYDNSNYNYEELNIDEKELYDKFKKYRTKTYIAKKIYAYEVFKNNDILLFVKKQPHTLAQLADLNCLTNKQLEEYGEDILAIVNNTFNRFSLS